MHGEWDGRLNGDVDEFIIYNWLVRWEETNSLFWQRSHFREADSHQTGKMESSHCNSWLSSTVLIVIHPTDKKKEWEAGYSRNV